MRYKCFVVIYTRGGDKGETSLFTGARVSKSHIRVMAYGTLDELNSSLGIILSHDCEAEVRTWLNQVQKDLFELGAWLANPKSSETVQKNGSEIITPATIKAIENQIDTWEKSLEPLKAFILPGGGPAGASAHMARTICRRAERESIALRESGEMIPDILVEYLNRLSDALFVLARYCNKKSGSEEVKWI